MASGGMDPQYCAPNQPTGTQPHPSQGQPHPLPVSQDTPSQKPTLPRSISQTNLDTTKRCRAVIQQDWVASAPVGGTNFFTSTPSFTLTLPPLEGYPREFKQFVFDRIIDKETQRCLEDEKCLNWCESATKLVPIYTMGDGNCLLHAASLGMWGFQDRDNILRRSVSHAVLNHQGNTFYRRWKYARDVDNQQSGIQLDDHQWQEEWDLIVKQASPDVNDGANLDSLEEYHVFVLANILRRPIIMYASPKMRSVYGSTLQRQNFHGVYLPLLWDPDSCKRDPLPLAFYGGHFSSLVVIESPEQYKNGFLVLPLTDFYGQQLPVRFTVPQEDPTSLLMDYLQLLQVEKHNSPYISRSNIVCAKLSIPEVPAYFKPLINGFIEACNNAYTAMQPPQAQSQRQHSNEQQYQQPSQQQQQYERNQLDQSPQQPNQHPQSYHDPQRQFQNQPQYRDQSQRQDQYRDQSQGQDQYRDQSQGQDQFRQQSQGQMQYQQDSQYQTQQQNVGRQYQPVQGADASRGNQISPGSQDPSNAGGGGALCIEGCGRVGSQATSFMCQQCFRQAQSAAQTHEQNERQQQLRQPPPPSTQSSGGSLSGSIKCPHCTNPGHPMYLGMCENCYRKRTTAGGGGGGSQKQPVSTQQGNGEIYESISNYQPQDGQNPQPFSPPAVPLPRNGTGGGSERRQCRMPGCEFFGTQETRFYCSKCFEANMEDILKEVDNPNMPLAPNIPSSIPQAGGANNREGAGNKGGAGNFSEPTNQLQGREPYPYEEPINTEGEPPKCYKCNEFFGSEEFGGMCNGCFLNATKSGETICPRLSTTPQFSNRPGSQVPVQQTAPVATLPRYAKCNNPDCNSPRNESGYCEKCLIGMNLPPPTTNFGAPIPDRQNQGFQPAGNQPQGHPGDYDAGNKGYAQTAMQPNYPGDQPQNFPVRGISTAPLQQLTQGMEGLAINCFMCDQSTLAASQSYSVCAKHAKQVRDLMAREFKQSAQVVGGAPSQLQQTGGQAAVNRSPPSEPLHDAYQGQAASGQNHPPSQTQGTMYGNEIPETQYPASQQRNHGGQTGNGQCFDQSQPHDTQYRNAGTGTNVPVVKPRKLPPGAVATPLATAQGYQQRFDDGGQFAEESEYVQMKPKPKRQSYDEHGQRDFGVAQRGSEYRGQRRNENEIEEAHRDEGAGAHGFSARDDLPKVKTLCRTAGCSFKGYTDLGGYCPDCYQGNGHNAPDPNIYPLV